MVSFLMKPFSGTVKLGLKTKKQILVENVITIGVHWNNFCSYGSHLLF